MNRQRYAISLPCRQPQQADLAADIADLLKSWAFPDGQACEVVIGLCQAGIREFKLLDYRQLRFYLWRVCELPLAAPMHVISHQELRREALCQ